MNIDRPGPQPYSEFFRRLRARPLSSWQLSDREQHARTAISELAALSWTAGSHPTAVPEVPDLGSHVIADQLEVLLHEAVHAGVDATPILRRLAEQLSLRLH